MTAARGSPREPADPFGSARAPIRNAPVSDPSVPRKLGGRMVAAVRHRTTAGSPQDH